MTNLNPKPEAISTAVTDEQPTSAASTAAADQHATGTEAAAPTNEQPTTTHSSTALAHFTGMTKQRFGATVTFVQNKYAAHAEKVNTLDTYLIFVQSNVILGLSIAATLHFGAKAGNMVKILDTSPMERFMAGGVEPITVSTKAMAITAGVFVFCNVGMLVQKYVEGQATFKDQVLESLKSVVRMQMGLLLVLGMYAIFESMLGMTA